MFFEGDLTSGITAAVQQQKVVACFVTDGGEKSEEWERIVREDERLSQVLEAKAIFLKIQHGSQEAGFLSAFCVITEVPTILVINQGQVADFIPATVSAASLIGRLDAAVYPAAGGASAPATSSTAGAQVQEDSSAQASSSTPHAAPASPSQQQTEAPSSSRPSVNDELRNAGLRRDADKRAKEAEEKKARKARAEAVQQDPKRKQQNEHAAAERERKQKANEDLIRIRKMIEDDKIERRERELRRKEAAASSMSINPNAETASKAAQQAPKPKTMRGDRPCALQVRLFDGRTIRTQFDNPNTQTLSSDVRKWVDAELTKEGTSSTPPYSFRHILPPGPPRTFEVGQEDHSLRDLDLLPSATLVLQPVEGYTDAYGAGNDSMVGRALGMGYSAVSGGFGLASRALGGLTGMAGGAAPGAAPPAEQTGDVATAGRSGETSARAAEGAAGSAAGSSAGTRSKTLSDLRDGKEDQNWYNGNQLSFQPKKDFEEKND